MPNHDELARGYVIHRIGTLTLEVDNLKAEVMILRERLAAAQVTEKATIEQKEFLEKKLADLAQARSS